MRRWLIAAVVVLLIAAASLASYSARLTPRVRERVVAALNERFRSQVELDSLQISVYPRPAVNGSGLRLRHNGRTDVPPLIAIGTYSSSAGFAGLVRSPLQLRTVHLERLEITIPPGGLNGDTGNAERDAARGRDESPASPGGGVPDITIEQIRARQARLEIVPRTRGKLSRVFEIHDLVLRDFGRDRPAAFRAALTNPTPRGDITTEGSFGPWHGDEPGATPIAGTYNFTNADLNTIKGISGTLSSVGTYSGVLERIDVQGETETPDFVVDLAGQPVPLKTKFRATVDGTNGNTWLEEVEARVLETVIVSRGAIERTKDVKGRRIALDVVIESGRIEDLLRLAVKSKDPLMTGRVRLDTKFLLPAGEQDVADRLQLEGAFELARARFTKVNVQQRINELSRRGRGDAEGNEVGVVSNLSGRFILRDGTLKFSQLTFAVPGAVVQLAGSMDLRREVLDFRGNLLLDASLAETTTGFKSLLARVAQPLFRRKGGGSKLPIRVSGTTSKPEFGLDAKRVLPKFGDQTP